MDALITVGLLALVLVLVLVNILLLANLDAHFTKPEQGTTTFVSAGESLKKIMSNVSGFKLSNVTDFDSQRWLIQAKDDKEDLDALFADSLPWTRPLQQWLWVNFGVRFVSWVWPHTHIQPFDIRSRKVLKEGADVETNTPLKSRVVPSMEGGVVKSTVVRNLLFLVPRPVYLDGVQMAGDNSRVNLLLLPVYRQVIPFLPVYNLKGDFFTQLDAAIEAAVLDFFASHRVAIYKTGEDSKKGLFAADFYKAPQTKEEKEKFNKGIEGTPDEGKRYDELYEPSPLTYAHWLKLAKAGGGSPLELHLLSLNVSRGYYDRMKSEGGREELVEYIEALCHGVPLEVTEGKLAKAIPSGIVPRFGFAMVSFRMVDWEPHPDTVELAKTLLAKEMQFHTAEGVRTQAEGIRDKTKIEADGQKYAFAVKAEGEASRFERLVQAMVEKGVTPDVAAQVVATQLRMENVRDSKLTTYVEGGAGVRPVLPVGGTST